MVSNSKWTILLVALAGGATIGAAYAFDDTKYDANVITDWNENAVALVTPRMVPGAAQRVVAIMQVAMFDAVNSIEPRYRPYLIQLPATPATSKEAAATAAAGAVLATLIPQAHDQVRGVCTENLIRVDAVMESPKLAE